MQTEPKAQQYLRLINDMLEDNTFNDASDFLKSVRSQIKEKNIITQKQMNAVNKIYIEKAERE